MLLGVLLALAAGAIVIYIVSSATTTATQTVTVIVATKDIPAGTILSLSPTSPSDMLISTAFEQKTVNADFVPVGAYTFSTTDQLNIDLNDKIIVGTFYGGDILRSNDERLVKLGAGDVITNLALTTGSGASGTPLASTGDTVDVLVSLCFADPTNANAPQKCETQTTLKNVYVYAVSGSSIDVVLSHQDALVLKFLKENGKLEIVVRKPGDTTTDSTTEVDQNYVIKAFGY
jgi:Flp pilus assembly protein CpaB